MDSQDSEILPHKVSYESLTHYQMNYFLAYTCIQQTGKFYPMKFNTKTWLFLDISYHEC